MKRLRQIPTTLIFAAICLTTPISVHATCAGSMGCSVDSTSGTDLTVGAAGNLGLTIDAASGQATIAHPMILGKETSTTDCSSTQNVGAIRYNPTTKFFEGCNGANWTMLGVGGVTVSFSADLCSGCLNMHGNDSEQTYTVPLASHVSPLPTDTAYQMVCTLVTNGNGASINIENKTTSSFDVIVNNSYTNYVNTPNMSLDCTYHHS